jgi:hypothetical protein
MINMKTKEMHICKINTRAGVLGDHPVVQIFSLGTSDQVSNCKRQKFY